MSSGAHALAGVTTHAWARRSAAPVPQADEALLRRVAGGDPDALTALYRRYADQLFGYLARLAPDRMIAEEILQDTLLAVWRSADNFAGRSSVRTWLFGVARRQAYNRLRTLREPMVDLARLPEPESVEPGPEELVLARLEAGRVADGLRQLAPAHREVLLLALSAELAHAEIAEVIGVPVGTVKSRLHHARAALARLLAVPEEGA